MDSRSSAILLIAIIVCEFVVFSVADNVASCFCDSQGQADLLKHAKSEALDTLRQIHCAAQSCGLSKSEAASPQEQQHQQQIQLQQPAVAKAQSQPLLLYQSQSRTTPQAWSYPLPQQHPLLLAPTLTVLKPPAYPQPPPLPQAPLPTQGQQHRAAGPLDVIPQKEMASDNPPGTC